MNAKRGKKYRLAKQEKADGRLYWRIEALRDIPRHGVKAGDKGGLIEKEENLSQNGDAWVGVDVRVCDNALVCDNANIRDNVIIGDYAVIGGNAVLFGGLLVCGYIEIRDGKKRAEWMGDFPMILGGAFSDDLDDIPF